MTALDNTLPSELRHGDHSPISRGDLLHPFWFCSFHFAATQFLLHCAHWIRLLYFFSFTISLVSSYIFFVQMLLLSEMSVASLVSFLLSGLANRSNCIGHMYIYWMYLLCPHPVKEIWRYPSGWDWKQPLTNQSYNPLPAPQKTKHRLSVMRRIRCEAQKYNMMTVVDNNCVV